MAKTRFTAEPGVPQIIIAREFDAPRELVFRAHTEPDLLERWLGPPELLVVIDRLEARHGGQWRYTHYDSAGQAYSFFGVFHGAPSPDRIVQTYEFDNAPGPVHLNTIALEDLGGRTLLRQNTVFPSVEVRDEYIAGGAEPGYNASMERLDALLAELAAAR